MNAYLTFQWAYQQTLQYLSRFVTVSDVFECFRGVLAAYIEEDFFSTATVAVSTGCTLVAQGRAHGCSSTNVVAL